MSFECPGFPAVLMTAGQIAAGTPELARLLEAPDLCWRVIAGPPWPSSRPPWRHDEAWTGEVEASSTSGTRRFQVACASTPDGLICQFVEESASARLHRLIAEAVDVLPDAFSITTSELVSPGPQFLFVNKAFTNLTGWRSEEVLGLTPRLLQGASTDRPEIDRLVACLRAGKPFQGGAVNYRKTSEPFWNEWNITAVTGRDGDATHYVSIMRDATARRVAQHRVEAAATEWTSIIDALDTNIVLTYQDGTIARCNRAFATLVDLSFVDLVGASLSTVLFGCHDHRLPSTMFHSHPTVVRFERLEGWFAVDGRPVSRDGNVVGWVHTLSNVTPSHQTAEQLHRLAAAAEQANDGIAVLDATMRIAYVNPRLARLLDRDRGSLLHEEIDHTGLLPSAHDVLAAAQLRASTVRHELTTPDGRRSVVEIDVTRITGVADEHEGYVLLVRDLTEREHLWRIAEQASTLGNIGNWLGGLRHELGNPVNSVKMALTVLQTHLSSLTTHEVARLVERAASELGRIEFLLRTLKTFSLYESLEQERIEIPPFFESLNRLIAIDLERAGVTLTIDARHVPPIVGDRRALHQVFVNLMSNAMDATTGTGGTIALEARACGALVELAVRDTGAGMSAAQLERLFQPFETTKPHGTGLGLVLVRRLVLGLRGELRVRSVLGEGTTMTMTFPAGV